MVEVPMPRVKFRKVEVTPKKITDGVESLGSETITAVEHAPETISRTAVKAKRKGLQIAKEAGTPILKVVKKGAKKIKRAGSALVSEA